MRITSLSLRGVDTGGEIVVAFLFAAFWSFIAFVVIGLALTLVLSMLVILERGKVMEETQETLLTETQVEQLIARRNPWLFRQYNQLFLNTAVAAGVVFVATFIYHLFFSSHGLYFGF